MDKITNDARVYTDVQGLDNLRAQYKSNPDAVKKEVSQQFEALLFQMVLRSMRDANNSFSSELFSSNDMSMYQDMFDKQLSLSLSSQGTGFAKMIEDNIDQQNGVSHIAKPFLASEHTLNTAAKELKTQPQPPAVITLGPSEHPSDVKPTTMKTTQHAAPKVRFSSPKEFIHGLWESAKHAAKVIGVQPSVLLAQAALETDWGKKIVGQHSGQSSHNLFNIKSDATWHKDSTTTATLEQKNGILVKENASFRNYESYQESFMDYAGLIKNSSRYQNAVKNAHEPAAYTQALQEAGYATDVNYSHKIMGIMKSPQFKTLLAELK